MGYTYKYTRLDNVWLKKYAVAEAVIGIKHDKMVQTLNVSQNT